jgi:hypothetical protein
MAQAEEHFPSKCKAQSSSPRAQAPVPQINKIKDTENKD